MRTLSTPRRLTVIWCFAASNVKTTAPWIWNVVQDRWAGANQLLDFYHASQHLWALGEALHGRDEAARKAWVEPRLHRLRHGKEKAVLREIAALPRRRGEAQALVRREQNYFATQSRRMNYDTVAKRGWPIGSGAVESACRTRQCRRPFLRCSPQLA